MSRRSSCIDSDYDYPAAQAKPILALPNAKPAQLPLPAKRPSLIRRASSGRRRENAFEQTRSAYEGSAADHHLHNNKTNLKKNFLSIVLPSPHCESKTIKANGVYYDVPKNIPVNPLFAIGKVEEEEGALYQNIVNPLGKPQVPPKSSRVLDKINTVVTTTTCKSVTSNGDGKNKALSMSTTLPPPSAAPIDDSYSTLNRKTTSKALPPLSEETTTSSVAKQSTTMKAVEEVSAATMKKPSPPPTAAVVNNGNDYMAEVIQGYKQIHLEDENGHDGYEDEDYDDQGDYEYDYVCLESTKRLNQEQTMIKSQLERHLQPRYERMVLNSSNNDFTLVNVERMANTSNLSNANIRSQILLRYRQIYTNAFETFRQWTKLSIEIINRDYEPAVFFNFLKHILLSAQMLITIINSLKRHIRFDDLANLRHQAINKFCPDFMDRLKSIVAKAKRTNMAQSEVNRNLAFQIRQEVIYAIQEAFELADALKVSLNNVI